MSGTTSTQDDQIAFVRRLLHFGVVAESLPVAAEETLGLEPSAARRLVSKALTEDDLAVIFPEKAKDEEPEGR